MTVDEEEGGVERTIYLVEVRCNHCEETTTFAVRGPSVSVDRDAPWPEADHCPQCAASYPEDLGWVIESVHEATVDDEPEVRADGGKPADGVERPTWVLILTCWPNDEGGFERPALALFDDREEAEDVCYEYMSNDGLQRDDYTVARREDVDSLPYDVSFDDVNDRRATGSERGHEDGGSA